MHSQRLSRHSEKTRTELCEIQQARHDAKQKQLTQVLDIMEMKESQGKPYDPADDGFVFSESQIEAAEVVRPRARQAKKARLYRMSYFE